MLATGSRIKIDGDSTGNDDRRVVAKIEIAG
jgi:hypothetical protein